MTGKGGVGKTTIAAALGLLAARARAAHDVVEVGGQARLAELFGARAPEQGVGARSSTSSCRRSRSTPTARCWSGCRPSAGASRAACSPRAARFQYFAAAAPGASELVTMIKIWRLAQAARRGVAAGERPGDLRRARDRARARDAALAARPSAAIARVGPIVRDTGHVRELLARPAAHARYVAVAQGTEMAVTETLELQRRAREATGPRARRGRRQRRCCRGASAPRSSRRSRLLAPRRATARANGAVRARGGARGARGPRRARATSTARSRGCAGAAFEVLPVPFVWTPALDLDALEQIAARLAHGSSVREPQTARRVSPRAPCARYSIPSRSSRPSSARQSRRTRTDRSRCTWLAERALELLAARPCRSP